jgi:signal transduction histidine kinase
MPDDYQIPAIALIAALMLAFAYLHSRFRSMRTLLWMLALGFSGLQSILRWMAGNWTVAPGGGNPLALHWIAAAGESCFILSSALFLASLSPTSFRIGKYRFLFVVPYIVPVLLYVTLYFGVTENPTGPLLRLYVFLAYWAAGAAIIWSLQKGAIPVWLVCSIVVLAAIVCMPFFVQGNVYYPLLIVESGNMLMSALLVLFTFRRLSPGVLLATAGFLTYVFPPIFLIHPVGNSPHTLIILARAVDLGKVIVAIGLILVVLEDEVDKNELAGERERRVRLELEAYARQSLTARSLEEFDRNSSQLCSMIVDHSCFAGAAMVVRNSTGAYSLVGYAGIDGATAGALDNLAQRLPADCFVPALPSTGPDPEQDQEQPEDSEIAISSEESEEESETAEDSQSAPEAPTRPELLVPESSSLSLDLTTWLLPGDDLERLHLTRVSAVPMFGPMQGPMQGATDTTSNAPDGALLLTAPRIPVANLRADDLLPLEILAARLQAARTQAMMLGKLIDSERFAGVGQLASNVAQQLNNPLTVILGYSALLEESASHSSETRAAEAIGVEARRMKSILARLSRFSRIATERFNSFSVADLISDIEQMHRTDFLRHSIEFRLAVQPDMPTIFGNAHQIRQALLHGTQYAIDSVLRVGANQEKSVRIEASASTGEESRIRIAITHSGPGFAYPDRAFDSLTSGFTGAESSGIGLSLAAAIVREHRGNIAAINLQPTGAAIEIDLPIS